MTVKYIDDTGSIISNTTATKVEPVVNGSKLLITDTTNGDVIIPMYNLIEIS